MDDAHPLHQVRSVRAAAVPVMAVISPVFNEGKNVIELVSRIEEACAPLGVDLRILLVNDGSDDDTTEILNRLVEQWTNTTVIHLSRNFGHQAALSAGLEEAQRIGADATISLDSDLQHPPRLIPELIAQWRAGYDVVYTIRDDRVRTGWLKRATSRAFYRLVGWMSETSIHHGAADFRLLGRPALDALIGLPERSRFLRGLTSWIGFRQVGVHYVPDQRFGGTSKYTPRRMYRLAIDGIVSMTTLPLRLILFFGIGTSFLSLAYLVYVVFAHFLTNRTIPGWSSVIVAVILLGGMNLTVLGVMGLYLAKVYDEVKGRPAFLIRERRSAAAAVAPLSGDPR